MRENARMRLTQGHRAPFLGEIIDVGQSKSFDGRRRKTHIGVAREVLEKMYESAIEIHRTALE